MYWFAFILVRSMGAGKECWTLDCSFLNFKMQLLDFTNVTNKTIGIENYDIIQLSGIPAVDSLMIR